MNVLFDGPAEVTLDGDRVTLTATSGGKTLMMTLRMEDALITQHRFQAAHAARSHGEVVQVNFSQRRHAETA
jgi:hypothetical protein